jgi:hypothetical protein
MPSRPPAVQLFVPDLLCAPPGYQDLADLRKRPALHRLLSRAVKASSPSEHFCAQLCAAFGVQRQQDWPVAAFTLMGDGGQPGADLWMRADPVHVRPTQHDLLLADSGNVSLQEAAELLETLNVHFAHEGLRWHAPHPQRWYVTGSASMNVATTPRSVAIGRRVDPLLPRGPDARRWHGRFNETQMLLHEHPVNQRRESRGEPAINSVWFWGGGRLPAPVVSPRWEIWADDPLLRGLALWSELEPNPLPANGGKWLAQAGEADHLILLGALADPTQRSDALAWASQADALEQNWFAPLREQLADGKLAKLTIATQRADLAFNFEVRPADLWKFWRRGAGVPHVKPPGTTHA